MKENWSDKVIKPNALKILKSLAFAKADGISRKEIEDEHNMAVSSAQIALDELRDDGFIISSRIGGRGNPVLITITQRGKELIEALKKKQKL